MKSDSQPLRPAHHSATPKSVAVIGMGYVGLPLSLQFASSGVSVLGVDIDANKVARLNNGESYIRHIASGRISEACGKGLFQATTDFSMLGGVDAVVICVPTPLGRNRDPDISYVLDTGRAIAPHLAKGALVVLESTTYPGTTEENMREVLESGSGMVAGADFHLAYSPEREDPGNPESKVGEVPKLVGGFTPACLEKALALYGMSLKNLVPVASCRVAEAAKLLENIFRSVNIALVNELKVVYGAMGIDIWEVIAAAKTKPFGFMPFYPGPGLGGHCIPIDPFYLTWKAHEFECATRFIELAGEINTAMPGYVVGRVAEALNHAGKAVNGSRILVLGLAYKPNVDDERESPSYRLMELLKRRGALISYYDPHVPLIGMTREHGDWAGTRSVQWEESVIRGFDVVIVATAHECVDYAELAAWSKCIVDTRNAMAEIDVTPGQVWKA
jgi:UDP-N-acetyl-D-glucosamine dehydrogenase